MSYFAIGKTAFQPQAKLFHATECTSALELRHCDGRNCEQSRAYHTNPDDNTDHVCKLMGRYVGEHEVCPIWAVMLVKRIDALLDLEKAAVAAESAASTARALMVDAERGGEPADGIRKRLGKLEQTVARSTERTQKLARLMENYIRKGLSKLDVEDKVYGFRSFSEHIADEAHKIATGAEPTGCEKCQECGRRYETCYRVPDDTWAQISGRSDGSGLLCISCADQLARNAGITIWWRGTGREFTKWEDGQR